MNVTKILEQKSGNIGINGFGRIIYDTPSTMVIKETPVKIYAWYDNKWGYMNRMVELTDKFAKLL